MEARNALKPLTHARLLEVLQYDSETGRLLWLKGRRCGREAGTKRPDGYISVAIDGCDYLAHCVIWLYVTGSWPVRRLDHKDTIGTNNRWSNLRAATDAQNSRNTKARSDNQSRLKGVCLRPGCKTKKYQAKIRRGDKQVSLGYFETPEAAHAAYAAKAAEIYGEFARAA